MALAASNPAVGEAIPKSEPGLPAQFAALDSFDAQASALLHSFAKDVRPPIGLDRVEEVLRSSQIDPGTLKDALKDGKSFELYLRRLSPLIDPSFCEARKLRAELCTEVACLFPGAQEEPCPYPPGVDLQQETLTLPVRQRATELRAFLETHRRLLEAHIDALRGEVGGAAVAAKVEEVASQAEVARIEAQMGAELALLCLEAPWLDLEESARADLEAAAKRVDEATAEAYADASTFMAPDAKLKAALNVLHRLEKEFPSRLAATRARLLAAKEHLESLAGLTSAATPSGTPTSAACSPTNTRAVIASVEGGGCAFLDLSRDMRDGQIGSLRLALPVQARIAGDGVKDAPPVMRVSARVREREFPEGSLLLAETVELGVAAALRRTDTGSLVLARQRGRLTISTDAGAMIEALQRLVSLPRTMAIRSIVVEIPADDFSQVALVATVELLGTPVSAKVEIPLIAKGKVNLKKIARTLGSPEVLKVLRDPAEAWLARQGGRFELFPGAGVVDMRVATDWSRGAAFEGHLDIAGLFDLARQGGEAARCRVDERGAGRPRPEQLVVRISQVVTSNGQWQLRVQQVPSAIGDALGRALVNDGFATRVASILGVDREEGCELARSLEVNRVRLDTEGRALAFDMVLTALDPPIVVQNLSIDVKSAEKSLRNAVEKAVSGVSQQGEIIRAGLARLKDKMIDQAAREFDARLKAIDGMAFYLLGLKATLHVDKWGFFRKAPVTIDVALPNGSSVTFDGIEVTAIDDEFKLPKLDTSRASLSSNDKEKLAAALRETVVSGLGIDLVSNVNIGVEVANGGLRLSVAADLPYLGQIELPAATLQLTTAKVELPASTIDAMRAAIVNRVNSELATLLKTSLPEEYRDHVGKGTVTLEGRKVRLEAPLEFKPLGVSAKVTAELSSSGRFANFDVDFGEQDIQAIVQKYVGALLSSDSVEVQLVPNQPRLLVKVHDVPIAGVFKITVDKIEVSPRGISIGALTLVFPDPPIPLTPPLFVSHPALEVAFKERRFALRGDVILGEESEARRVYRLEAALEGNLETKQLKVSGRTVLVDVLPVFESVGLIDFASQVMTTSDHTVGPLASLFPTQHDSTLSIKDRLLTTALKASLLGVSVDGEAAIELNSPPRVRAAAGLSGLRGPFGRLDGSASLQATLPLRDVEVAATGSLNLGLKVDAEFKATLASATISLDARILRVTVIAPSARTLTNDTLTAILRKLLKPSLDFSKINRNITISLLPPGRDGGPPQQEAVPTEELEQRDPKEGQQEAGKKERQKGSQEDNQNAPKLPEQRIRRLYGVPTRWISEYIPYGSGYSCWSDHLDGASPPLECTGPVVSTALAQRLMARGARWIDSEGAYWHPACRAPELCPDRTPQATVPIVLWMENRAVWAALEAHDSTPVAVTRLQDLTVPDVQKQLLQDLREGSRPRSWVPLLLRYQAEADLFGDDQSRVQPFKWNGPLWGFVRTSAEDKVKALHLVDPTSDAHVRYTADSALGALLFAVDLNDPGSAALKDIVADHVLGKHRLDVAWSAQDGTLLRVDDAIFLAQGKQLGRRIRVENPSNLGVVAPEEPFASQAEGATTGSRPFWFRRLPGPLERELARFIRGSSVPWEQVQIKNDTAQTRRALFTSSLSKPDWHFALVLAAADGRARTFDFSSDATRLGLSCWLAQGWIANGSIAHSKLADAATAGPWFAEMVNLPPQAYDEVGFRVNPRLLAEGCPTA